MCNLRSCCAALSLRSGCVALEDGMPMPAPVSQDALWSQERVVSQSFAVVRSRSRERPNSAPRPKKATIARSVRDQGASKCGT